MENAKDDSSQRKYMAKNSQKNGLELDVGSKKIWRNHNINKKIAIAAIRPSIF